MCAYDHHAYMSSHARFCEDVEELDAITALRALNPQEETNREIYGERKPWCVGCGHVIQEDAETVEALDMRGNSFVVHELCSRSGCVDCDTVYVNVTLRYNVTMHRSGYLGTPMILNVDFTNNRDGDSICSPCLENGNYGICDHCSEADDLDCMNRFDGNDYCESCYEDNVSYCEDCDESYWNSYNHECENGPIKPWDYKPDPVFFGHSGANYYLGLELEVENTRGNYGTDETARVIADDLGRRAYLKHDGSIADGFEIVTHPHTLDNIREEFDWSVLERLTSRGFRSWNAEDSSCGIHVHVSRTAFAGSNRRRVADHKGEAHLLRFMKLIYDNQRQVERLAGRSSDRWANFSDRGRLVNKVKNGHQSNGRYSAVNTDNYNTSEVRVFKGSLNKKRVLSALEFVTAAVEYTRDLKVNGQNRALDWSRFVAYVVSTADTYPNLMEKIADSLSNEVVVD